MSSGAQLQTLASRSREAAARSAAAIRSLRVASLRFVARRVRISVNEEAAEKLLTRMSVTDSLIELERLASVGHTEPSPRAPEEGALGGAPHNARNDRPEEFGAASLRSRWGIVGAVRRILGAFFGRR
jgi:hypothetical protein